jgi:hypothetical protein
MPQATSPACVGQPTAAELERYLLELKRETTRPPGEREFVIEEVTRQLAALRLSARPAARPPAFHRPANVSVQRSTALPMAASQED